MSAHFRHIRLIVGNARRYCFKKGGAMRARTRLCWIYKSSVSATVANHASLGRNNVVLVTEGLPVAMKTTKDENVK